MSNAHGDWTACSTRGLFILACLVLGAVPLYSAGGCTYRNNPFVSVDIPHFAEHEPNRSDIDVSILLIGDAGAPDPDGKPVTSAVLSPDDQPDQTDVLTPARRSSLEHLVRLSGPDEGVSHKDWKNACSCVPSTFNDHRSWLSENGYVFKDGKEYKPTEKAIAKIGPEVRKRSD